MSQTIIIPTINDSMDDFELLFSLWNQVNGYYKDIRFDFSQCHFLRPNAVAFIGGLARQIMSRSGKVNFDWASLKDQIKMNLAQNSFATQFGYQAGGWTGNSIQYREDIEMDFNIIMNYLSDNWLGRGWIGISERLKNSIAGNMWEIYNNAFEHAGSQIGVFSCGQHFPKLKELVLTVIDFGQGIASNVRNFLKHDPRTDQLTAAHCLKWAFEPGTTTRPNGMARGLGLDLLKAFIKVNNGKLEVYSNNGYAVIDGNSEAFYNRHSHFEGTIFHITLICDENKYKFADEI
jgi:hypothetical protein